MTHRDSDPSGTRSIALDAAGTTVLALAVLMLLALVPGVPGPARAAVAVAFFLLAPGLSWVGALPVTGWVERGAVVVALSLAADVVAAEALLYLGVVGVAPVLGLLLAVCAGGLAVTSRLGTPRPEREIGGRA